MSFSVYFGLVNWEANSQLAAFYPEDLPQDWRLAFYSTRFRCVYLPFTKWAQASDEEVAAWLNDTRKDFVFVLEKPSEAEAFHIKRAGRFGKRGVFDDLIELHWLGSEPDLRGITRTIQKAIDDKRTVYLISREANLALMEQINELMQLLGV